MPLLRLRKSKRTAIYKEHAEKLLQSGHAYRCFCPPERLHKVAVQQNLTKSDGAYDRHCLNLSEDDVEQRAARGDVHVIRLKMPEQVPDFNDLTFGLFRGDAWRRGRRQGFKELRRGYDDPILMKSDALPTYHLANVVDDHYMRITHVIRAAVCTDGICQTLI